jgi:hypothetical protein
MSLILVTGGAWALCLAKLVLLRLVCSPDSSQDSQALSTQKERTALLHSTGAQPNLLTAQRDAREREREHEGRISCGLLSKFSHRRLLHWVVLRHNELHGPCPSRSPTASGGRFSLLLENELCFILFLMGRAHRRRRENVLRSQVGPGSLFGGPLSPIRPPMPPTPTPLSLSSLSSSLSSSSSSSRV